jgi:hypothetical protein
MNMLHIVQELVCTCATTRDDVSSFSASATGYTEFVEPNPLSSSDIRYIRLFNELKTPLI